MAIEAGSHLYPYRTQKLSPRSPMVLRGFSLGRVGRCQDREEEGAAWKQFQAVSFFLKERRIKEDLLEKDKRQAREKESVPRWLNGRALGC